MEVSKIKLHTALTCGMNDSISELAKKMKDKKERRIFVLDEKGKIKGIITTTDLVYKVLPGSKTNLKASEVMTENVQHVDISKNIEDALTIMNALKTFTCPISDKGKLLGVISYYDLVGHVVKRVGGD